MSLSLAQDRALEIRLMPLFSRRHYVALAAALASGHPTDLFASAEYARIVDRLIQLFERDNPSFNRRTFESAVYRDGQ